MYRNARLIPQPGGISGKLCYLFFSIKLLIEASGINPTF